MSLDEKIGQLIVPSFFSEYTSSDSETYDHLVRLVHEYHEGGMLVFGTREPRPDVLLNRTYSRNARGQPLIRSVFDQSTASDLPYPVAGHR